MSVAFYMDQHIPQAITESLRLREVDTLTAHEDSAEKWDDEQLLERASQLGRTVFSEDEDLLTNASNWQQSGREFAGVIYAHQLRITIGQAITDLELIAKALEPADLLNLVIHLPF